MKTFAQQLRDDISTFQYEMPKIRNYFMNNPLGQFSTNMSKSQAEELGFIFTESQRDGAFISLPVLPFDSCR